MSDSTTIDDHTVFLTLAQAAAFTTLSRQYLGLLARANAVPHSRIGRRIVFRRDRLVEWIAEREQIPAAV